ncbi:MAG: DEAD/DEAH box helicase family protein, partial [Deltaproteobacteria bacterium]|nr:DEAD/DEAH box helicase family protein [Deltaproteobacteria bacterium]
EGRPPELRERYRRPAIIYAPRDQSAEWDLDDGTLRLSREYAPAYELVLVNLIRERVKSWREQGYPGVTRTTLELLQWWRREGREKRLFFAQLEGVETIIFLKEARADFLQGIVVPVDRLNQQEEDEGRKPFTRYACKMATGSGKTTVMGMLAAWSILNKVNDRRDSRFSDVVLAVCPNVTIRNRLQELDPRLGEASIYRKRDIVPPHLMSFMTRGRVLISNWHVFELQSPQVGGESARVVKIGVPVKTRETIAIGSKTTTARGSRYMTQETLDALVAKGELTIVNEERDEQGRLRKVQAECIRYVESDSAWLNRILGREVGRKQNLLVFNDEAHHAYRIRRAEEDRGEEEEENTVGEEA